MPASFPDWDDNATPRTHSDAQATRTRFVSGVPAIRVRGASYRSSQPIDGVFELVDVTPQRVAGEERFEVYCAWFGVKPRDTFPRISVTDPNYELIQSYTGEVIDNISTDAGTKVSSPHTTAALPEEITNPSGLIEGAIRTVTVNAYERSSGARDECIAAHGTSCVVCGFSFGAVYGPDVQDYIHVHHLRPLSEIGRQYLVDPVADLRPVCPNCHAVIHLGGRARSIDEVRKMIQNSPDTHEKK